MWNSFCALRRRSGCDAALDSLIEDEKLAIAASIRERRGRKSMLLKVKTTSRIKEGTCILKESPHGVELILNEKRR
jgi:hypothetical protein